MNNLTLALWCCVFLVQMEKVVLVKSINDADKIVLKIEVEVEIEVEIETDNIYSSAIKYMLTGGSISKIHIFVADTFYADDDLQLNGVKEFKVFTNTWNNTQPVVFDLSGSIGVSQQAATNGSAGHPGENGTNGGNFVALAHKIFNGDYLTVISNGGNGGDGQDAGTSADTFVLLNVDRDIYPSGWFSNGGDLRHYYKKYFRHRGYDAEIEEIDDYTSLYAVFVLDRKFIFHVRLHPQKCCGTTGIGGVGGFGGRHGNFQFLYTGNVSQLISTPKLIANDGFTGKAGKDGKLCENLALDIQVVAELKRVIFIALPLHYSLSSHFTVLNHTKSSKCSPMYVTSIETTVSPTSNEESEILPDILRYKNFLLENMNNGTLTTVIHESYKAIDENQDINDRNSLRELVEEFLELERNYLELRISANLIPLYQRLSQRINTGRLIAQNEDDTRVKQYLNSILQQKLIDLRLANNRELNLMNLSYIESITNTIEYGNRDVPMITDANLQNKLDQLRFQVNGNHILALYRHAIEQFKISYFPFAVDYLEDLILPVHSSSYDNLDQIIEATVKKLKMMDNSIKLIKSMEGAIKDFDGRDPQDAFYTWKNEDFRERIRNLFEGKEIKLLANVIEAKKQFNAIKFNTIDLVLRSLDETVNDQLNDVLESFNVQLKHSGQSLFRCNDIFYELTSDPMSLEVSFNKDNNLVPLTRNGNYAILRYNDAILSPYTLWKIQLVENDISTRNISDLVQFKELDVNIELHGSGTVIEENAVICENRKLANFYTEIM